LEHRGSGLGILGGVEALADPSHAMPASATLPPPPFAALYFQYEAG
jgi:1,4-alpha-glucan branching enzyme